jgi:hypothetical protein
VLREGLEDLPAQLEHLLGLLGVMPLVVRPEDLLRVRIDDYGFHRRRAHVHADYQTVRLAH